MNKTLDLIFILSQFATMNGFVRQFLGSSSAVPRQFLGSSSAVPRQFLGSSSAVPRQFLASRALGFLLFSATVFFGKLNADPITLDNNTIFAGTQSLVAASLTGSPHVGTENDVNSLPYFTLTSAAQDSFDNSTLTNTLTTSSLDFGFSEIASNEDADAFGVIIFQAGSNTTFSISGLVTVSGLDSGGGLEADLRDETTSTEVYDYVNNVEGP